eukprot:gene18304-21337_t
MTPWAVGRRAHGGVDYTGFCGIGQQMIHNPIVKHDVFVEEALDNVAAEKSANVSRHSRHSMECDIADVLAGSYSHHRMQSMDESSRSRLLMQSTFSQ